MFALVLAFVSAFFLGVGKVSIRKGMMGEGIVGVLYTLIVTPIILLCLSIVNGDLFMMLGALTKIP